MSTEPASLIPLMKGVSSSLPIFIIEQHTETQCIKSQHVALIGDHKQLPPVILSSEARDQGLAISLFERLTEERGMSCLVL